MPILYKLSAIHTLLYLASNLASVLKHSKAELVIVSVGTQERYLASVAVPRKWLYIPHTYPVTVLGPVEKLMLNFNLGVRKQLLAVSQFTKSKVTKWWLMGRAAKYVHVIPNFGWNFRGNTTLSKKRVLTVGHVEKYKGPGLWLDVARHVVKKCPDAEFIWVGGGSLLEKYQEVTAGNKSIKFTGFLPQAEIAKLQQEARAYFQPSAIESFGLGAVDAMSFGIPSVVSDVGGLPEVVENGVTGYVVPLAQPDVMVAKFELLLKDDKLARQLGDAAAQRYQEIYTFAAWSQRLSELHEQL